VKPQYKTPRVATPIVATPKKDYMYNAHENREGKRHDAHRPTLSVAMRIDATPTHNSKQSQEKPQGSDTARCWQNDEQRRHANRRDANIRHQR
jgi:hypothetical protein